MQLALYRSIPTSGHLFVLAPDAPCSEPRLDLSFPSLVASVACEALRPPHDPRSPSAPDSTRDGSDVRHRAPPVSLADKSIVTPPIVRFLLSRYARRVKPHYDMLEPEVLSHDGPPGFKHVSDLHKFKVLIACAVAAACESCRDPRWAPLAQVCRDWAGELVPPIIASADEAGLTAILLLLLFELAEPSRGLTWELLDLAIRVCLKLGWLHSPTVPVVGSPRRSDSSAADRKRLVSTLVDINRQASTPGGFLTWISCMEPNILLADAYKQYSTGQAYSTV